MKKTTCCIALLTLLFGCQSPTQTHDESLGTALAAFNRGAALLEQYNFTKAADEFNKVLDVAPDWTAARFNLALAYLNLQDQPGAKDHLDLARRSFEKILLTNPNHLHAHFCLGLYYQHLGNNEKALEHFQTVYEKTPRTLM